MTKRPVHYQTGSSTVKCGAKMGAAWDLGNATTELRQVTCEKCLPRRA